MPINPERLGNSIWCLTLRRSLRDLLANFNPELRTAYLDAVGLRQKASSLLNF
jgi:gluconate kinase